jgi:hypothetical protein
MEAGQHERLPAIISSGNIYVKSTFAIFRKAESMQRWEPAAAKWEETIKLFLVAP